MQARIYTLKGPLYEGEAKKVNVKTFSGEITILDHHQPLVSVLAKDGRVWLETMDGARHEYPAPSGFLHMNGNNELTVLID